MLKKLEQRSTRWYRFVIFADFVFVFIFIVIGISGISEIESISLLLSIATAYIAIIRPHLRKPKLGMFIAKTQCSSPTSENDTASWFIRLGIMNYGFSVAKNCVGRILGVWTEQRDKLEKYDPLPLFWARQDKLHTDYHPVNIQGYKDVEYLDIAQVKKDDVAPLKLRVAHNLSLTKGDSNSPSPGSDPVLKAGVYYIQVAVYAEETNISPRWFKLTCSKEVPECNGFTPCQIEEEQPKWA